MKFKKEILCYVVIAVYTDLLGRSMLETIQNSKCDFSDQSKNHKFITNYFKILNSYILWLKVIVLNRKRSKNVFQVVNIM